jgi:hypothetical protein
MEYFFNFDNNDCLIDRTNNDLNSKNIYEQIKYVKELKDKGHKITIYTTRSSESKDIITERLTRLGIEYDELLTDIPLNEISHNINALNYIYNQPVSIKSKKISSEIVPKSWGKEIIFVNNDEYCGKILCFEKDQSFSMHYHLDKKETWYISKGSFIFLWIETENGFMNILKYLKFLPNTVMKILTDFGKEINKLI